MSVYDELLTELEDLAKAMPEADEKLESKSEEDEENEHAEPDADDMGGPSDHDEDNEDEEMMEKSSCDKSMAKSMSVTLEDGTSAEVIDGMELIKSMQAQLDATVEGSGKVLKSVFAQLKEQAELVKSLKSEIGTLKSEGRGRKTAVVSMSGAPAEPMAKSMSTPSDVLAKCIEAQSAGRLTALDVSVAEGYVNRGMPIPDRIASALS